MLKILTVTVGERTITGHLTYEYRCKYQPQNNKTNPPAYGTSHRISIVYFRNAQLETPTMRFSVVLDYSPQKQTLRKELSLIYWEIQEP